MNDRELLEMAAKAAGLKARWFKVKKWRDYPTSRAVCGHDDVFGTHHSKPWNPLADDGEALRLAVKLRMCLSVTEDEADTAVWIDDDLVALPEPLGDDECAAMRRAIVRTAAEIGKSMP